MQNPHSLPDKSPSFKDFMGNKNNRFINPTMASKNRIQPPSKVPSSIYNYSVYIRNVVYHNKENLERYDPNKNGRVDRAAVT